MFGLTRKSRTEKVKDALREAASYTDELVRDRRLHSDIRSAIDHGAVVTERVRRDVGLSTTTSRLVRDRKLRKNLSSLLRDLDRAGERVRRRRVHRVRNALLMLGGTGVVLAAVPNTRRWVAGHVPAARNGPVPSVATAP
jgi:hypothetical protein